MIGHGEKLTRKRESAIAALLTCSTVAEAASSCGVAESTLRRWLKDQEFARSYRKERGRMLEATLNLLRHKSVAAVLTLADIAADANAPHTARVSAARGIIELALRGTEIEEMRELADRLTRLEARAQCAV